MDNTVFVYGIFVVILLMAGSLVGMAFAKPKSDSAASVEVKP